MKTKIKNIYNFLQFVEKKRIELMERATWGKFWIFMRKKRLLFKLLLFCSVYNLLSCNVSNPKVIGSSNLFREVTFSGCEYYQIEYGIGEGSVYRLIHKDSCKNHHKW